MKTPPDATKGSDAGAADAPQDDVITPTTQAPSKEEVERALARLVDAVLPDSRPGRRPQTASRTRRRAS